MALIREGVKPTVTIGAPRLSTPEPLEAPRWQTDFTPQYDFGTFLKQQEQSSDAADKLAQTSQNIVSAAIAKREAEKAAAEASKAAAQYGGYSGGGGSGAGTPRPSGGWGPSRYGVTGRTGLDSQKGSAPYGLQPRMWSALQSAFSAMKAAGLGSPGITDGWRSYAAQVDVARRKPGLAATPGRSVHGLGWAADLDLNSRQQKWLERNGAKFGLARLPSESWHWQYVGGTGDGKQGDYITPDDYGADGPQKGSAPHGLQPEMYDSLQAANAELQAAGLPPLVVNSGYRSPAEQRKLQRIIPQQTTSPAKSAHTIGEAADLDGPPASLDFLRRNAARYGLVPTDEPWHFQRDPATVRRWRR